MTISAEQFKQYFPEFKDTENTTIELWLDHAHGLYNASLLGSEYEFIVMNEAADNIASGPMGERAKKKETTNKTIYRQRVDRALRPKTFGYRLI